MAKGFSQRPDIDFEETFPPVVKHDSLRFVLALAAVLDLEMLQLDVKTAFLNGDQCRADQCVYVLQEQECLTIIAIWVDDGLICSSSVDKLKSVVDYLAKEFEMTCGPPDCFVGIKISRDRAKKIVHLHQENYIRQLLKKFWQKVVLALYLQTPSRGYLKILAVIRRTRMQWSW